MKSICTILVVALLVAAPLSLWAQETTDGASIFKARCSGCHGANGEGKPNMKMPAVKGTQMTAEKLVDYLTKGLAGKKFHENPVSGLSADQAKLVADHVKSLK